MAMFWYLDLLTYGRGAFLAMLFTVVCASFWCFQSLGRQLAQLFLRDQLISFGLAVIGVFALRSSLPFSNMASRLAVDLGGSESGRWQILLHWVDSWLKTSVFWGQGWGVIPENVAWAPWSKDPHNIYIQILADGGVWGGGCILLVLMILLRSSRSKAFALPSLAFAAGLLVYQGVDRIWAMGTGLCVILLSSSFLLRPLALPMVCLPVKRLAAQSVRLVGLSLPVVSLFLIFFSDGRP